LKKGSYVRRIAAAKHGNGKAKAIQNTYKGGCVRVPPQCNITRACHGLVGEPPPHFHHKFILFPVLHSVP